MMGWMWWLADRVRQRARRASLDHTRSLGLDGEDLAHRHLQRAGLTVVARNYRTPGGSAEIDIVAREGNTLVFVEVKTRQTEEFGAPDRAIDAVKRDKIRRAARNYLRRSGHDPEWVRFDTVAIVMGGEKKQTKPAIEHVRGAWT